MTSKKGNNFILQEETIQGTQKGHNFHNENRIFPKQGKKTKSIVPIYYRIIGNVSLLQIFRKGWRSHVKMFGRQRTIATGVTVGQKTTHNVHFTNGLQEQLMIFLKIQETEILDNFTKPPLN